MTRTRRRRKEGGGVGEPAGRIRNRFRPDTEVIGPEDCPILHRWTLYGGSNIKVLVHHFLANADDRAVHDHPRPFYTFVLRGGYDDLKPCPECSDREDRPLWPCWTCVNEGVVLRERMYQGKVRLRPANHRHRTKVWPEGCWTLVIMGPVRRRWGFWQGPTWYFWQEFERLFGYGMRCSDD